jgi:hypothetical protein
MANHTTNCLQLLDGSDLGAVLAPYRDKSGDLDFNTILPLPPGGDPGEVWGTKRNSYSGALQHDGTRFWFETAWSPPLRVVEVLAEVTERPFLLEYADEQFIFAGWFAVAPGRSMDVRSDGENVPRTLLRSLELEEKWDALFSRRSETLSPWDEAPPAPWDAPF